MSAPTAPCPLSLPLMTAIYKSLSAFLSISALIISACSPEDSRLWYIHRLTHWRTLWSHACRKWLLAPGTVGSLTIPALTLWLLFCLTHEHIVSVPWTVIIKIIFCWNVQAKLKLTFSLPESVWRKESDMVFSVGSVNHFFTNKVTDTQWGGHLVVVCQFLLQ